MKKLILIDGNALVHRAFHALPALTSAKGVVTNAVYGFTAILLKTIKDLKPGYIAAAFDLAGPTFRHEQFEDYKIHRVKAPEELYRQIPLVKEILSAFGIPVYEKAGYEADDLIGTLATRAKKNPPAGGLQTVIATGDLDTLQLVDGEKVVVFTLRKGMTDTVIYNEKAVFERYGLKPEQLSDYRGLKGDPSDNIPGVPGVGEKTAGELIQKFGGLDKMYEFLENQKLKIKSQNDKAKVKNGLSPRLVEKLLGHKDQAYFSKQLSEIITDLDVDFSLAKADWRKNLDLPKIEKNFKDLGFFSLLKRLGEIGLSAQTAMVIPENKSDKMRKPAPIDHDSLVGHGLKETIKAAIQSGGKVPDKLFDTMIAAWLVQPDLPDYDFHKIYYGEFRENADDPDQKSAYLRRLKNHLWNKMQSADLLEVFEKIEMPLIPVLAEMELNGVRVSAGALSKLLKTVSIRLGKLERKIYRSAGGKFNINSPQQLAEVLYDKLAIKGRVRKTGKGAPSTAAPELEKLRDEHPIIDLILEYRELQKLKTTYIEPFPELIAGDGRIHTTYNQTGTATGRLSSENPNLQNIPIKTSLGQEFRKAFVAADGCQLVSFDYSQLELRIVAHVAKDEKMIEIFRRGEDIHTRTAVEIFEVEPQEITKEMRRQAKVLNFGIIYGMGTPGFARAAGVDRQRARQFIDRYFAEFSGVARYMEEIKAKARRDGYVQTLFGRRRPLLDIYSTMPQIQAGAERAAINHPIQGTAADLMKLAMISTDRYLHENFNSADAKLLLQVHDEIVCEVKTDLVKKAVKEIKSIMESVHKLEVPIIAEVKAGDNWQEVE